MKLKTKARVMFVVYTALVFFQVLFCVLLGGVTHYISKRFAEDCFDIARELVEWRNDAFHWYVVNAKRGYSLDIE